MAKVSMTQETVEGRLTDFPLEVSLMLRAAEDRPDPGGPGAVVHSRNKSKKGHAHTHVLGWMTVLWTACSALIKVRYPNINGLYPPPP
ncbi:unnamed protein product [Boreogadus saida]